MIEISSLIDELEDSINNGTEQRRLVALRRVSDMFVAGSSRYSPGQIALFDDVLLRLADRIEQAARVRLSHSLAGLHNAPPKVVRSLAFDDAIEVAAPILTNSPQLSDADLVANARTKSQGHLMAISQRSCLSEAVTDVLVDRGDSGVVRSVAENSGARFSYNGFGRLIERAQADEILAETVGSRADVPRHYFLKLLEGASAVVRTRLVAANPQAAALIRDTVAEISGLISREVRNATPEHVEAKKAAKKRYKIRQPSEGDVHMRAHAQDFEKTVVALALFGRLPIDLVERALLDERPDMVLILARAAGCSRTTTKAILLMQAAGRGMSESDLDQALTSFDRLSEKTAKRVLEFYDRRKAHSQFQPAVAEPEPEAVSEAVA
jgi:uncharacterized protein (DUF2336 family)